ncbi:MAG: lipopolysaccharide biosynthesis protein [bacterium]
MDLKRQTTVSIFWSGLDKVGYQVLALVVGIFTARLLTPTDFGYIAALAIFTALSNILVESGFTSAMVRRPNNSNADYTAAFIFNILLSIIFYLILFFAAPRIADYFNMPPIISLSRVIFSAIVINSFSIVPNIILTQQLKFKGLATANLGGMVVSSVITLWLAVKGYGYWAIAAQQISQIVVKVIILWIQSKWLPTAKPNFRVIKELLSFSSILILSNLITTAVRYIYNFFIGPRYSSDDLGYYGQAYKFHLIPVNVISTSLSSVAYPVLSTLNDEKERQLLYFQKLIKIIAFITFPVVIGLIATTENFITVVLTDKWMPMAEYFKLMLVAGATVPFIAIYGNLFTTTGRPKVTFLMDLIRNLLIISLLFIFNSNINQIILGYIISNYISMIIICLTMQKINGYNFFSQIFNIIPPLVISLVMGAVVYYIGELFEAAKWIVFITQIVAGAIVYFSIAYITKMQTMNDIMDIIKNRKK